MPTGNTWTIWIDSGTTATSGTDNTITVWNGWVATSDSSGTSYYQVSGAQARELTPEERAERQARADRERLSREARERERAEAKQRARDLLDMFLTPEQRESLEQQSAFIVKAESERMYRIKTGRAGNIEELDADGKVINRLCVHPVAQVPDYDTMLTQKIWLETNEEELRRIANISPVRQ